MPIKVLHCIHSLSGGGAEKQLVTLANNVKNSNMEFAIFCVNPIDNELKNDACQLYKLTNKKNYPWKMLYEIKKVIEDFKPDIVHCWLPITLIAPGLLAAKLASVPAVTSYRTAKKMSGIKDIAEFMFDLLFADAIVSNNTPLQSHLFFRYLYKFKYSELIPNAVDVPVKLTKERNAKKLNTVFTILFVGRLIDVKNWKTLIDAISNLTTNKTVKLEMCGQGEASKVQRYIDSKSLTEKVKLLGFKKDVYSIMAKADLMVLPSWHEGMPNVVLEAMSIGLPCVVSSIVAHTSLFENKPIVKYFNPASSSELSSVLDDCIEEKVNLDALSKNAMAFSKSYKPSVLINRYENFYKHVIEK